MEHEKEVHDMDITEADRNVLMDINEIEIDMKKPIEEKSEKFIEDMGNMFLHNNEDYIVKVSFNKSGYTATEAMIRYLKQVAELKY